jgi:hypothetical protein
MPRRRRGFRLVACPKGPILEVPARGRFIFERLSPGTIREPDFYENFRIVPGGKPGTRLLVACRRGETRRGKCRTGQRVLRIWHQKRELKRLLRECRQGRLGKKRRREMDRIRKDVDEMSSFGSLSRLAHGVFKNDAQTLPGRVGQFLVNAVLGTVVSVFVIRTFFPNMFGKEPALPPAPGTVEGLYGLSCGCREPNEGVY